MVYNHIFPKKIGVGGWKIYISVRTACFIIPYLLSVYVNQAEEPDNVFAAPAPDFFLKEAQAPVFFPSGSGSWYFFFERLQGGQNMRLRLLTIG